MLTLVVLLAHGAVVHVVQLLVSGGNPHRHLPEWLSVYFLSLTLVDPLAAVLPARRHRSGVELAVVVLVTDAAANAVADYVYDDSVGVTLGRVGQAVLTVVAGAAVATAPATWRAAGRDVARQGSTAGRTPPPRATSSRADLVAGERSSCGDVLGRRRGPRSTTLIARPGARAAEAKRQCGRC